MSTAQRISSAVAYLPVIGWIYVFLARRQDALARFHLRQSIGWFIAMIFFFVLWVVVGWLLTWIPFLNIIAIALFTLVMAVWIVGAIAWIVGVVNALRGQARPMPLFGGWAARLP